jgi:transcriptional regulator with XRE-family HTH domain
MNAAERRSRRVGRNISAVRRQLLHLTQAEFGRRLVPARSHAAVSDIERGKTAITVALLDQIGALASLDPGDFLSANWEDWE